MESATRVDKPETAPQLEYAPVPRGWRKKRTRRVVLLVVLLALIYPAWRYGPGVYRQGKMLYLQRRCLNYTAASDCVVYEEDAPTVAERAKLSGFEYLSPE